MNLYVVTTEKNKEVRQEYKISSYALAALASVSKKYSVATLSIYDERTNKLTDKYEMLYTQYSTTETAKTAKAAKTTASATT